MNIRVRLVCAVAIVALTASAGWSQEDPDMERGFSPEKIYQMGDIDSVNLFNGAVALSIPLGPSYRIGPSLSYGLTLSYSSNVWDYTVVNGQTLASPTSQGNAGIGWMVRFGILLAPGSPNSKSPTQWQYVGADGAEHFFYGTLHEGDAGTDQHYKYTRDGSYLRLHLADATTSTVEFPSGLMQTFSDPSGTQVWKLTRISDRFNDYLTVDQQDTEWTLTDSVGRTHKVNVDANGFVTEIDWNWVRPGTQALKVSFTYSTVTVLKPCKGNTDGNDSVSVLFLDSVAFTDGGGNLLRQWGFSYNTPQSPLDCSSAWNVIARSATINKVVLPTGGYVTYDYDSYIVRNNVWYAPGKCDPGGICRDYQEAEGVLTKKTFGAGGDLLGQWDYMTDEHDVNPTQHESYMDQRITQVTGPAITLPDLSTRRDDTVAYFTTWGPNLTDEWQYGLPYASGTDGNGRHRSVEYFAGAAIVSCNPDCSATAGNGATKLRSEWVRYERDLLTSNLLAPRRDYWNSNRRVASERTVYEDDANCGGTACYADTNRFNFDGLGHYRVSVTGGNFTTGPPRRKDNVNFNFWNGVYKLLPDGSGYDYTTDPDSFNDSPGHSFWMWPTANPWILNTSIFQQQSVEGGATATQETCYDSATGFLRAKRTLAGASDGPTDLLAVYSPDASGNVASEQYFGGDAGGTPSLTTYCTQPWVPIGGDQYRIDHTYQYGSLATSQYKNQDGSVAVPFLSVNRSIDRDTGLPVSSWDSAGFQTGFEYDALGRLTWSEPAAGAWNEYIYTAANGTTPAQVDVRMHAGAAKSGAVLTAQRYLYDGFGRLTTELQLRADAAWPACDQVGTCWNQRLTAYNGLGWKKSVSEWQHPGDALKATTYTGFDPFGRVGTVTAPDGSQTITEYNGTREVKRKVCVNSLTCTDANKSVTIENYDHQGRLASVQEPTGGLLAQYGYDVGGRLATVTTSGGGVIQNRTFNYDLRGLLRSETLPEEGAFGNGSVTYAYDSRGHTTRQTDGTSAAFDLTFLYDRAERATQVKETGSSGRLLKQFTFADSNGPGEYSAGKLRTSTRHNYYNGGAADDLAVSETLTYAGLGGRISQESTTISLASPGYPQTFSQSFTWNDLGQLTSESYPQSSAAGPARTINYARQNGFLTAVAGYANAITYLPSGMVGEIDHSNGVNDIISPDPNAMARPSSIATSGAINASGAADNWSSGAYAYDGAGNVVGMGSDYFLYDGISRITEAQLTTNGIVKKQAFTFDPFGNLQQIRRWEGGTLVDTRTMSIDSSLNRIKTTGSPSWTASYDDAGDMTAWNRNDVGLSTSYAYSPLKDMRTMVLPGGRTFFYGYDADGERVATYDSGMQGGAGTLYTLRGLDGKVRREFTEVGGTWSWKKDYIYRDGQLLASNSPTNGTRHYHLDHLGSPRLLTDRCRVTQARFVYFPFGEEASYQSGTQQNPERMRFTGHERDLADLGSTMDDLDYMHARYYSPILGRLVRPDKLGGTPSEPQSWNKYAYAGNNPLVYLDPNGMLKIRPSNVDTMSGEHLTMFDVLFETRSYLVVEALSHVGGLVSEPLHWISRSVEEIEKTTRPWTSTDTSGIGYLSGAWAKAAFEARVQDAFKNLGARDAVTGFTVPTTPGTYTTGQIALLQQAIEQVVAQLVKEGKITEQEAKAILQAYDVRSLIDQALHPEKNQEKPARNTDQSVGVLLVLPANDFTGFCGADNVCE